MARNETFVEAPAIRVFEVLADPFTYAEWVVGSREVRHADTTWPSAGAAFGHTVGVPPFLIRDQTIVLDSEPPVHLVLEARAKPLPTAHVAFRLQPQDGGTQVTMIENFAHPVLNLLAHPLGHSMIRLRNRETLRRLKEFAERPREAR